MIKSKYISDILDLLLDGDDLGQKARLQLEFLIEKDYEYTGVGLFVSFNHSDGIGQYRLSDDKTVINGVEIRSNDLEIAAEAMVHVINGLIDYLEIWSYSGEYPTKELVDYILLVSFSQFSFGQENKSEAGGPPERSELIGFWKKVEIPNEQQHNKVNPWPQKYQWFGFYENGKVYSMMSDTDSNYSSDDLKRIFKALPQEKTPDYKLHGQFLTIDNKEIKDYQELWGVNLFAVDVNEVFMKGYLIMTLDDGSGNVIYYRLLRPIK